MRIRAFACSTNPFLWSLATFLLVAICNFGAVNASHNNITFGPLSPQRGPEYQLASSPQAASPLVKFAQLVTELSGAQYDFTVGLLLGFEEFNSNNSFRGCPQRNFSLISNQASARLPLEVQITQLAEAVAYVGNAGDNASFVSATAAFVPNEKIGEIDEDQHR